MTDREKKELLQRIADSLERIAISLEKRRWEKEPTEDFYKEHGITQTFS